jgi:hypothetical protein
MCWKVISGIHRLFAQQDKPAIRKGATRTESNNYYTFIAQNKVTALSVILSFMDLPGSEILYNGKNS